MGKARIQQIYGYLVCLVAIIALLTSISSLTRALFDLSRPKGIDRYGQIIAIGEDRSTSYEDYRLKQLERATQVADKTGRREVILDDSTMRRIYQEQRAQVDIGERWSINKSIVTSTLMIIVAGFLFFIHWRWLRSVALRTQDNGA